MTALATIPVAPVRPAPIAAPVREGVDGISLELFQKVPEWAIVHAARDNRNHPLIRKGEIAIVKSDGMNGVLPAEGELFLIEYASIPMARYERCRRTRDIVQTIKNARGHWCAMTQDLPLHVALADEPLPPIGDRDWAGPDLGFLDPVEVMLLTLTAFEHDEDEIGYIDLWLLHIASVGCRMSAVYERSGEVSLSSWQPCDPQMRHRSRYVHFLVQDLDRVEGRRELLTKMLIESGQVMDQRPKPTIRDTFVAVRSYLAADGRILITPEGRLDEGAGVPAPYHSGTADEAAECMQSHRAYHHLRKHFRADRTIKRIARALGRRTDHGWIVLEAQS